MYDIDGLVWNLVYSRISDLGARILSYWGWGSNSLDWSKADVLHGHDFDRLGPCRLRGYCKIVVELVSSDEEVGRGKQGDSLCNGRQR